MFKLITEKHEKAIHDFVNKIPTMETSLVVKELESLIDSIRNDIPEKKKISYGRYSIIKRMGLLLYPLLVEGEVDVLYLFNKIFINSEYDQFVRSLSVQLISIYGEKSSNLKEVLPFFEKAAMDDNWEMRECSAGFIRKLVKAYPDPMHDWYLKMVKSENAMQRRFASESLRPVADNGWFKKNPEFAFSIIENLYKESNAYPRTSVGNSLSDWMRIDEERALKIVRKLAKNGNKNSYWIAYRACRNIVKKDPIMVMNILQTDEYLYKDRKFYRKELE